MVDEARELEATAGLDRGTATDAGLNGLVRGGLGLGTSAGPEIATSGTNAVAVDAIARQGGDVHIFGHDAGA